MIKDELKKQLDKDYSKVPKKYFNNNNLEMTWNEDEKLYIGIEKNGEEWITSIQHTNIPFFTVKCTNKKDNSEIECGAINFIPIFDNKIKCRKCNQEFNVQLNIPKSSVAYPIWEKLQQEG